MASRVPPLHSTFAGRVDEQELVRAAVQRATEGRPGAVFVHGESGVGKTRLAKTVSVHVSNLLRKTGTTSRLEAAEWARRNGVVDV